MNLNPLNRALVAIALTAWCASAQEVIEFEGPQDARIYVVEGNFRQAATMDMNGITWDIQSSLQATMDVNSGAMVSSGDLFMSGLGSFDGTIFAMAMDMSFAMKSVIKKAGSAVRWSGNADISGPLAYQQPGTLAQYVYLSGTFKYKNMTLDPATGEQTGDMSYKVSGKNAWGEKITINQPATLTTIPRPDIYASEGAWRATAGNWSSVIFADVDSKGKITGAGKLIVGDARDPYAMVDQSVKGNINSKTGLVSLSGTGATSSSSKVKITLKYENSSGETLAGKSSIKAYNQSRKF